MFFDNFPREFTKKRVIVNSKPELYSLLNTYNCVLKKIYISVYNVQRDINIVAFDFDNKEAINNIKKLHFYLMSQNIKHLMTFSTRGFWCYVFTKSYDKLLNKKEAIKNSQLFLLKWSGIEKRELDEHVIGNIEQMTRMPNSYDVERKRYCIPITEEDLKLGYQHIIKKSQTPQLKFTYYCKELFDISLFDKQVIEETPIEILNYQSKMIIEKDSFLKQLPLCVASILIKKDAGWKERFHVILYFKERGFSINETDDVLKQFFSKEKYRHCIKEERQLQYIYARDFLMSSCDKLRDENLCIDGCKSKNLTCYI